MHDAFVSRVDASAAGRVTISVSGRVAARNSEALREAVMEALRPQTQHVIVDLGGVHAFDDRAAAVLVQVEEDLTDEACFLEVRGTRPSVEEILSAAGLAGPRRECTTAADLATVDQLLAGASGRADRPDAAAEALARLVGPDMCNVQTFDAWSESLRIDAQQGFQSSFLTFFARVSDDGSACGLAMGRGEMVVVEDVTVSPVFCGTPALDVMLEADARAVVSMPFFDPTGRLAGVVSMHHRTPDTPSRRELLLLRLVAARLGAMSS